MLPIICHCLKLKFIFRCDLSDQLLFPTVAKTAGFMVFSTPTLRPGSVTAKLLFCVSNCTGLRLTLFTWLSSVQSSEVLRVSFKVESCGEIA